LASSQQCSTPHTSDDAVERVGASVIEAALCHDSFIREHSTRPERVEKVLDRFQDGPRRRPGFVKDRRVGRRRWPNGHMTGGRRYVATLRLRSRARRCPVASKNVVIEERMTSPVQSLARLSDGALQTAVHDLARDAGEASPRAGPRAPCHPIWRSGRDLRSSADTPAGTWSVVAVRP